MRQTAARILVELVPLMRRKEARGSRGGGGAEDGGDRVWGRGFLPFSCMQSRNARVTGSAVKLEVCFRKAVYDRSCHALGVMQEKHRGHPG